MSQKWAPVQLGLEVRHMETLGLKALRDDSWHVNSNLNLHIKLQGSGKSRSKPENLRLFTEIIWLCLSACYLETFFIATTYSMQLHGIAE